MSPRKNLHIIPLFFALVLTFLSFQAIAQYSDSLDFYTNYEPTEDVALQHFDSTEWKKLTESLDYGQMQEEKPKERGRKAERKSTSKGAASLMQFLLIAGGIALLVFLFYTYFNGKDIGRSKTRNKKTGLDIEIDQLEKDLPDSELDPILVRAEKAENYRLAIRLRYLMVIQKLSEKEIIKWKKDKTNGQYARELRGTEYELPFRELTRIFERLWYGQNSLTKQEYLLVDNDYENMERILKTAKSPQL